MSKAINKCYRRLFVTFLMLTMVFGLVTTTSSAEAELNNTEQTYYAVEFSYNGQIYETLDVAEIPASDIAAALGLEGEVESVTASNPFNYYSAEERDGQWYIHTNGAPSQNGGTAYSGDLFNGEPSIYFKDVNSIVIRIGGVNRTVTMKFIMVPIYLNDPGAVDGVTVGDNIYTFASGMPLSTVYIDNANFQTPTSCEILTSEPGFVQQSSDASFRPNWVVYDPNQSGATQLGFGEETIFEGPIFSFTFKNAAILSDGTVANVKITYSDVRLTTDNRGTGNYPNMISLAHGKNVRIWTSDEVEGTYRDQGELYSYSYSVGGIMNEVIQIVDDNGDTIEGTFIAGVEGINVPKSGATAPKPLSNAYLYDYYSESVQVNGGGRCRTSMFAPIMMRSRPRWTMLRNTGDSGTIPWLGRTIRGSSSPAHGGLLPMDQTLFSHRATTTTTPPAS